MVGFNPTNPQKAEGSRMEPPKSVPSPRGDIPEAMAEASPPLEPPAVCSRFHGLRVSPNTRLPVSHHRANSGMLVFPSRIPPAPRSRVYTKASCSDTLSANSFDPKVIRSPAVSMQSFSVNGTPCRGPNSSPRITAASASRAKASGSSCGKITTAFSLGFNSSMRSKWACTTSTGESALLRINSASS